MNKKAFSYNIRTLTDATVLELHGSLNETAKLPDVPPSSNLIVSLDNLAQVNSLGVREWCSWIKKLPPTVQVSLEGCPFFFVKSFSLIRGALPRNARVDSMYLPFYSPKTREERSILVKNGLHFSASGLFKLPEVLDSQGNPMQIEAATGNYLIFLKDGLK